MCQIINSREEEYYVRGLNWNAEAWWWLFSCTYDLFLSTKNVFLYLHVLCDIRAKLGISHER